MNKDSPLRHRKSLELKSRNKHNNKPIIEQVFPKDSSPILETKRHNADGESMPNTPPNELVEMIQEVTHKHTSFNFNIQFDGMAILLLLISLFTRFIYLEFPRHVVFDEMHYGKYAFLYLKRTFFFDSNPPLGKLMIAFFGYLSGYNGNYTFDKIGESYPDDFPVWSFRFFPALAGSTLSPLIYLILNHLDISPWFGALAGFMVIFDTALLTQSRFVLLESIMLMFVLFGTYSAMKFKGTQPLSLSWFFWLTLMSTSFGAAFCVKYTALYSLIMCFCIMSHCFWNHLANRNISNFTLFLEYIIQFGALVFITCLLYISTFYIHLSLLYKAGVHDSLMTSAFQASLEGGLSSILKGQPRLIAHGSQITLRHTHGKTCWLHSHEHVYPIRYSDGRGSSHQQQVSCYGYKDVNNWWIVKRPEREDLAVTEPVDAILDGDIIQLVHGLSHRALNSHDVAAPMSPHNQEVSCYIDYNISMKAENHWKVQIVNSGGSQKNSWHSVGSQIRLLHLTTGQALKFTNRLYPEWGFFQNEVACDKVTNQLDSVWNVEEHRYTKNDKNMKALERELITSELIPIKPTVMSFWEKFLELQLKMLLSTQENVVNHNYASDPLEWPFLTRGIAYYIAQGSNAQVHLLGNIVIWYFGSLSLFLMLSLHLFYLLRRQRHCWDIPESLWIQFSSGSQVLFMSYSLHYIPFYFYDRTLFLHHYFSAYLYKIMISSFFIHHIYSLIHLFDIKWSTKIFYGVIFLLLTGILIIFSRFYVLSYGFIPLSANDVRALRLKSTWDLIIHTD